MNIEEAKHLLADYRSGRAGAPDAQTAAALELARREPELRAWMERQEGFHRVVEGGFRSIPVAEDAVRAVLQAVVPRVFVPYHRRPEVWAVAATLFIAVMFGVIETRGPAEDSLTVLRSRMVRSALREYRMDIVTNDLGQIRQFLSRQEAPSDFELRGGLSGMPLVGAGLLSWQGSRVSMVCLSGANQDMWFLFVADRASVRNPPAPDPEFIQVNQLATAAWSAGARTYVLAARVSMTELERSLLAAGR